MDLIQKAILLHQKGSLHEAIGLYEEAMQQSPTAAGSFNLGLALAGTGQLERARLAYMKALHLDPSNAQARNNLALLLNRMGRPDEGEAILRSMLEEQPDSCDIAANLAGLMSMQGRPGEGASVLYPRLKGQNFHPLGWDTLGVCLQDLGDLEAAKGCFYRSHGQDPSNAETLFHLHAPLYDLDGPNEAIRCLESAHTAAPGRWDIRFHLHCLQSWESAISDVLSPSEDERDAWLDSWKYMMEHRTERTRLFATTSATLAHAVASSPTAGLVAEFGVRHGSTLSLLRKYCGAVVHGFDSFQGLPEDWHGLPQGSYSTGGRIPLLGEGFELHPGLFGESLPLFMEKHQEEIRLLHIDCDLHSSTQTVLQALAPRMQKGTVIVFDEYFMNPHWRLDEFKAWQEAVEAFQWRYEYIAFSPMSNQAAVILL
jgi:tetratricopeptide (TPR) repeat protein